MNKNIQVQVIRSSRKTIAMRVTGPNEVEIRAPRSMRQAQIDDFIRQHEAWLSKHLSIVNQREQELAGLPPLTDAEIRSLADQALGKIPPRVRYFSKLLNVTYGSITIRNQKSKWGSCSSQGNLNFNCLLMLCPPEVMDYVVIHELCHRKEMNHSPRFWAEVENIDPDYKAHRQWLKDEGNKLIGRMGR
ncbi:MAG: M48 family metallopeptidase [Clostridia bacterium]|nr:M48 family metallopeptidase [Clostridia bacterium]